MGFARSARLGPVAFVMVFACSTAARAEDIGIPGATTVIAVTKFIHEDSQLVGDVICTMTDGPCIQFGAPNITLRLRGFTLTGPANPDVSSTCQATPGGTAADGISNGTSGATSQPGVQILGPGMVQKFRRHGILIIGAAGVSTAAAVKGVTSHHNCFSGVFLNTVSDSVVERVVSVRNSANSGPSPCGGNCVSNSRNNHILMNIFSGNGSVHSCASAPCATPPAIASANDFGVGLVNGSAGNLVELNNLGGNTNGILIHANASGNTIRQNVVAGNPPSQVSRDYGPIAFDIKDESASNGARNTFDRNWCITYSGPGPSPCPSFPASAPPTITGVTATPDSLWPPNGRSVPVTLEVAVSDDSDAAPACEITNVTANEPLDAGSSIVTGPLTLSLTAERAGSGGGRIYTVTVTCTNSSQLSASATATVAVPHDRR